MTEYMTMAELARQVVARGLAASMTRTRVAQLAATDPNWPVPQSEWRRVGHYWQIPWDARLEAYFAHRDTSSRPKGWTRQHRDDTGQA
ncbi:MAG: hypothetical protein J2P19_00320 [Pseudonocardia sp.]|nr:hypothetical protein [Pseudonocardia sp.]